MATKIVIIGSGEIGKAILHVLSSKSELEITVWSRSSTQQLSQLIPPANFVFLCVPSWAMAEVIQNISPHLSSSTILISLAKGIDTASGKTLDELLRPPFALLAGPMLAEELMQDLPGAAVIASADTETATAVSKLFSNTTIHTEASAAVHQTALASVLKNVYALGLGIAQAKRTGDNFKGQYIVQAVAEMAQLCGPAAYGLAGLGDLVATGISSYSTNHQTGMEILAGKQSSRPSEGLHSLSAVKQMFASLGPIPTQLKSIIDAAKL